VAVQIASLSRERSDSLNWSDAVVVLVSKEVKLKAGSNLGAELKRLVPHTKEVRPEKKIDRLSLNKLILTV
jgi:hypothetical protein